MSRRMQIIVALFACWHLSSACETYGQTTNTNAWLEDFAQLKREMSDHHANLEWAIEHRGLDLKQLSERTETRLRQSRSDSDAQKAIESFLSAFGDGHPEGGLIGVEDAGRAATLDGSDGWRRPFLARPAVEVFRGGGDGGLPEREAR